MQTIIMAASVGEFICSKIIGAKSFEDGSQDICKDTESNFPYTLTPF